MMLKPSVRSPIAGSFERFKTSAVSGNLQDLLIIFFISLFCLALELFLTRILNLKTFNHIVYVVIPFAILGYGIGANLFLLTEKKIRSFNPAKVVAVGLILLSGLSLASVYLLIHMNLSVKLLEEFFLGPKAAKALSLAYLVLMVPFVVIGFMILFFFSKDPKRSSELYFWDLMGAGMGAFAFFILIPRLQVIHSIFLLSSTALSWGAALLFPRIRALMGGIVFVLCLTVLILFVPEIRDYATDGKGWENFPKYFKPGQYQTVFTRWHPLGRTDAYRLVERDRQRKLYAMAEGTFEVNLVPPPEFTYLSTNFLGGTPVYHLAPEGLQEYNSQLQLFSQAMEFPYTILDQPKVVVIGTGGGRDIFMAKTHGAAEIVGAEINPGIYQQMTEGGELFDYSGRIYREEGVKVSNIDGRHMVKNSPRHYYDLIILNGVDTFSGLSSGAYAYAESYLYTKDAVIDYLNILNDGGVINFNRWIFQDKPRETLRLFVIIMEALKEIGVENPWEHVLIGAHQGWGMTLVKKTPFHPQETRSLIDYFSKHNTELVYPSPALLKADLKKLNFFDLCSVAFRQGSEKEFIENYTFDISVITDDNPFFYKYYRFRDFKPKDLAVVSLNFSNYGAGFLIFMTQGMVLFNAILFCLVFMLLPLFLLKKQQLRSLPGGSIWAFLLYYSCLGVGFMFIEIPLMQKFGLLLGSPIYAISVTLAALLIFSGLGSLALPFFIQKIDGEKRLMILTTAILFSLLGVIIHLSGPITNALIGWPFALRVAAVSLILLPLGLCLGTYFPSGLRLIQDDVKGATAWAWGINCGFSVIGSMLAIILAQFHGFNLILNLAIFVYALAALSFFKMLNPVQPRL